MDPLGASADIPSTTLSAFDRARLFRARLAASRGSTAKEGEGEKEGVKRAEGAKEDEQEQDKSTGNTNSQPAEPIKPSTASTTASPPPRPALIPPQPSSPIHSPAAYTMPTHATMPSYPDPASHSPADSANPSVSPSTLFPGAAQTTQQPYISPYPISSAGTSSNWDATAGQQAQAFSPPQMPLAVASGMVQPAPTAGYDPYAYAAQIQQQHQQSMARANAIAAFVPNAASPLFQPQAQQQQQQPVRSQVVSSPPLHQQPQYAPVDVAPRAPRPTSAASARKNSLAPPTPSPTVKTAPLPLPLPPKPSAVPPPPNLPRKPSLEPPSSLPVKPKTPISPAPAAEPAPPHKPSDAQPLFSLPVFVAAHGGPEKALQAACESLDVDGKVVQGLDEAVEGEGAQVDAAVALRRAQKVEEAIKEGYEKKVLNAAPSAALLAQIHRASAAQSFLYLALTLPSLPTFSSLLSYTPSSTSDPPALTPLVADALLRLAPGAIELGEKEGKEAREGRTRLDDVLEVWRRECKGWREEKARRAKDPDGRTAAEDLKDARLRISKLDTRLSAVQNELKVAQGAEREWREKAVKAEARLEEKPTRRAALLLEQVESLTASRDALSTSLSDLQASHSALTLELEDARKALAAAELAGGSVEGGEAALEARKEVEKLRAQVEKLEGEVQRARDAAEADAVIAQDREETLRREVGELKKAEEGLKRELEAAIRNAGEKERAVGEWRDRAGKAQERVAELEERVKALKAAVSSDAHPSSPSSSPSDHLSPSSSSVELDHLRKQVAQLRKEGRNKDEALHRFARQLREANRELEEKRMENTDLLMKLVDAGPA
ncbi:hypothetical protein JCM8097_004568 [Rhodosporidiobolus ruineniae]